MPDNPAPGTGNGYSADNSADVQPDQGQGAPAQGLYDLNSVPEHLREHVTPILKQIEGNVTRRFQQHADQAKAWEPYQNLGLNELDPQEVQELIQFRQLAQDPDAFKEWYDRVGEEYGYNQGSDPDELDDFGDGFAGMNEQQIEAMIQERVQQAMEPMDQQLQEQQWEQQVEAEHESIEAELDDLGITDTDERTAVLTWAYPYGDDPEGISKGYQDYQKFVGSVEQRFVKSKTGTPSPALNGGRADTAPQNITDYGEAKAAAMEMLRKARS